MVTQEGDRGGPRRRQIKQPVLTGYPLFELRIAATDVATGALQDLGPDLRRQGQGGEAVGERGGAESGVLVQRSQVVDHVGGGNRPSNPQAG